MSGFSAELEATVADVHPSEHTAYRAHRQSLEIYAFFLQLFITIAEKGASKAAENASVGSPTRSVSRGRGRGRGGAAAGGRKKTASSNAANKGDAWSWDSSIPEALRLMAKVLKQLRTERIWQTTTERDTFLSSVLFSTYEAHHSELTRHDPDVSSNLQNASRNPTRI